MKFILLFSLILATSCNFYSQSPDPIVWSSSYKASSPTEGEIIVVGSIGEGWHTYSQRLTEAGPISTVIQFTPGVFFELQGKTEEVGVHEEYDKAFEAKLFVFSGKAEFRQKIKVKSKSSFTIPISVEYVCCNDNMCLPPKTIELSVKIQ